MYVSYYTLSSIYKCSVVRIANNLRYIWCYNYLEIVSIHVCHPYPQKIKIKTLTTRPKAIQELLVNLIVKLYTPQMNKHVHTFIFCIYLLFSPPVYHIYNKLYKILFLCNLFIYLISLSCLFYWFYFDFVGVFLGVWGGAWNECKTCSEITSNTQHIYIVYFVCHRLEKCKYIRCILIYPRSNLDSTPLETDRPLCGQDWLIFRADMPPYFCLFLAIRVYRRDYCIVLRNTWHAIRSANRRPGFRGKIP